MLTVLVLMLDVDHFTLYQVLDSRALLRIATLHFAAINVASLLPHKAWLLSCVAILPIILTHPLVYVLRPDSWDFAQGSDGWLLYAFAVCIMAAIVSTSLASSYTSEASFLASQLSQASLAVQAARSQALLETAIPPTIARALLGGVLPEELTASFDSVSIAFIALTGFDDIAARMPPRKLLEVWLGVYCSSVFVWRHVPSPLFTQWLHVVFQSLDALVDAYGGDVTKVETVRGSL